MKITYWSDFNCPYSYIGLKRLTDAVEELNLTPEWELKAFELEPSLTNDTSYDMITRHAVKFNLTRQEAKKEIDEINKIAAKDNLEINCKNTKLTSSRNAHRLVKYTQNRYPEISQKLIFKIYEANFKDAKKIADINVLAEICESLNLDKKEIKEMLLSNSNDIEVSLDIEDARFNGLNSIPFYILTHNEEQLSIPGAFEKIDFKIAIEDLISGKIRYKTFI